MTTLVVGASGSTGRQLVNQLLNLGQQVKVIVRSPEKVPGAWKSNHNLTIIQASILELSDSEMSDHLKDCQAVASCLGHNLNLKGIFGPPRRLVSNSVMRLSNAIINNQPEYCLRFVLMNTTGNRNRDLNEPMSLGERVVLGLLRAILPPQVDNEEAADYLRINIGQSNPYLEWVAVRPDGLIDEKDVSAYELYPSPIRSAIFNAGKTSRINVGDFMAHLCCIDEVWNRWKGQMPVIYNTASLNDQKIAKNLT